MEDDGDNTILGTFNVEGDGFEFLGILECSHFFHSLCTEIAHAINAGRTPPLLALQCHLDDSRKPPAVILADIDGLASFLSAVPSMHHIFVTCRDFLVVLRIYSYYTPHLLHSSSTLPSLLPLSSSILPPVSHTCICSHTAAGLR